jgi:hypothetical protein
MSDLIHHFAANGGLLDVKAAFAKRKKILLKKKKMYNTIEFWIEGKDE